MNANSFGFLPPAKTLDYWNKNGLKPIIDSEISMLEDRFNSKVPKSYSEFLKVFGGVEFGFEVANQFSYTYNDTGNTKCHYQVVGHIKTPERVLRYYNGLADDNDLEFPRHLLPFAMDLSQGELFIEFGKPTERIFYWNFDKHDWTNPQMRLGFVADNMYDFINNLELGKI